MPEALAESVRSLLREPFKDPSFRRSFFHHFDTHPNPLIKKVGMEWLQEQLTFES